MPDAGEKWRQYHQSADTPGENAAEGRFPLAAAEEERQDAGEEEREEPSGTDPGQG